MSLLWKPASDSFRKPRPPPVPSLRETQWLEVSRLFNCPICHHDTWCRFNGEFVVCRRISAGRTKTDIDGLPYWVHRFDSFADARFDPKDRMSDPARRKVEDEIATIEASLGL